MNPQYGQILDLGTVNSNLTQKYRRNGKLQSCEPCRKSKLRCDHTLPACGRCVKRRRVEKCVYHPSPLTKRDEPSEVFPSPTTSSRTSALSPSITQSIEPASNAYVSAIPASQPSDTTHAPGRARAASAPVILDDNKDSGVRGHLGFLGSTSYSSIFEEDLGNLFGESRADAYTESDVSNRTENISVASEKVQRGCKVLSSFQNSSLINEFINRYCQAMDDGGDAAIIPIIKQWRHQMWQHHQNVLRYQAPDKICRLSEQIWRNTGTPIVFNGTTSAKQWTALSTGHNLRWEVLGLLAVEVGICAQCISPTDSLFKEHKVTRQVLSKRMHDIGETCLSFCRDLGTQGDCFLWLLQESELLTYALRGGGNYAAYILSGELNNAFIATGMHQTIKADSYTPFFLAEIRKRNRLQIYGQEVGIASMLGRPCRLSWRYTNLDLPLDLNDSELFLEGQQLQAALAQLDENGWNKTGKWSRVTFLRANTYHATRREDVLDVSLGNYTPEEVLARVAESRARYEAAWATAPESIRWARDTPTSSHSHKRFIDYLYTNVVRQGYLGNQMLLQRVLIRKTGASSNELIDFARAIFKDCMYLTGHHAILEDYQLDYVYLLANHGLRSAAILAVELLKQEQSPEYPLNPRLPRSETIQDLSIFVARLKTIDPTDGLYSFCEQGRKVIACILDKILSPPQMSRCGPAMAPAALETPQLDQGLDVTVGAGGLPSMDFGGLDAPLNLGHDTDFMVWLENMEWEKAGGSGPVGGWTGF